MVVMAGSMTTLKADYLPAHTYSAYKVRFDKDLSYTFRFDLSGLLTRFVLNDLLQNR